MILFLIKNFGNNYCLYGLLVKEKRFYIIFHIKNLMPPQLRRLDFHRMAEHQV